ncbi:unnamed protein product [Haemonchus placei]|uniref:GOLGA2L5 domain-containing protein n=1 Tax=Haemonchus placei TaxID=6290 RepID=A0A0N4VXD2_HAEPC|nr:unnamed protein product [Haemonchus placei]
MELKEKFDSVVTEKENLLQVLNSNQDKDKEAVQLLQKELSAANNSVMEHAKEKEGLLVELESLKKTVAAEVESKNAAIEEISLAKQQIQQLSEEKKALEDQLQKSSRDEAEMKERVSNLERDKVPFSSKSFLLSVFVSNCSWENLRSQHEEELKVARTQLQQQAGTSSQVQQQVNNYASRINREL